LFDYKNKIFSIFLTFFLIIMPTQAQITFNEISENPSDLDLNLRYAKEQEVAGRYKSTIASLERLNMLYSENTDIKLYLLSFLLKVDASVRLN
jgi:hypothetical protein